MKRIMRPITIIFALAAIAAAGTAQAANPPVRFGTAAPNFITATLDGELLTMDQIRGHVLLFDFWTTWCPVCRDEATMIEQLSKEFGPKGLIVVGLNCDQPDTQPEVRRFVVQNGMNYIVTLTGDANADAQTAYNVISYPTLVLIDKNGYVRWSQTGAGCGDDIDLPVWIKQLLAEKRVGQSSRKIRRAGHR